MRRFAIERQRLEKAEHLVGTTQRGSSLAEPAESTHRAPGTDARVFHNVEDLHVLARNTEPERTADDQFNSPASTVTSASTPHSAGHTLAQQILAASTGGEQLDSNLRAHLGRAFRTDLHEVRIHTDREADRLTKALAAEAFTSGRNVFFASGAYEPTSATGRQLLTHEIAHVIQQIAGPVAGISGPSGVALSDPSDPFETAADRAADAIAVGHTSPVLSAGSAPVQTALPTVQRKPAKSTRGTPNSGRGVSRGGPASGPIPGEVDVEPLVVLGVPGQFEVKIVAAAQNVSNRAQINAGKFAQQVESACEAFKIYADPKVKDLEGAVTAGKLLGTLVETAAGVIIGQVTAQIASKVARDIAGAIAGNISSAFTDRAKKVLSNDDDVEALRQAISAIAMAARDNATNLQDAVRQVIDPVVTRIIEKVNAGEDLAEEEETFIQPLYSAPPDIVDAELERMGVPSESSAKATHVKVFTRLVEEFEKERIWAQASFRDRLEMGFAQDFGATELTLGYKARGRAAGAAKTRLREMEGAGRPSSQR
jgi:hypothetical protein